MKPREPRHKVLIQARMRMDGAWGDVCIRDISSRGLLLQAVTAPERGNYVEIFRAGHIIIGRVVWKKDRRFGVRTQDRLNIEAFVQQPLQSHPERRGGSAREELSDRISSPRQPGAAVIKDRIEQSQRISAAFQFVAIALFGAFAATIAVSLVGEALSSPLARISSQLAH